MVSEARRNRDQWPMAPKKPAKKRSIVLKEGSRSVDSSQWSVKSSQSSVDSSQSSVDSSQSSIDSSQNGIVVSLSFGRTYFKELQGLRTAPACPEA